MESKFDIVELIRNTNEVISTMDRISRLNGDTKALVGLIRAGDFSLEFHADLLDEMEADSERIEEASKISTLVLK